MTDFFLNALKRKNHGRPPVWLMRQAGRYMPAYRAIREKHSFIEMCKTPELAAKITMLPIHTFGFDAAILFSDILLICEALGQTLHYKESIGPVIDDPLSLSSDVERLSVTGIERKLSFVKSAILEIKNESAVPLIGFAGAPFTVASYMIEGGTSRDFKKTKRWMIQDPASFHHLLEKVAKCTIDYLNMQIDAGVSALQLFDSWAHVLSRSHFKSFSLSYLKKIMDGLKDPDIPVILFCRGSSVFFQDLASIKPACVGIDWNADIQSVRKQVGPDVALQGNLDPDVLFAPPGVVRKEAKQILDVMENDPAYIFNLGHGIKPDTPEDSVRVLVESVQG